MGKILIKDCAIVPISSPVIEKGVIAIDDDRLHYVGPTGGLPADWQPDTVIEAGDKVALPGLVNAHTHAAMTLLRSYADDLPLKQWLEEKIWPREDKLTREDIYWGAKLALLEMIRSGTTTFADMYFQMDAVAEAVVEAGLRACLSQGLIGLQDGQGKRLAAGVSLVKEWHGAGDGRVTTMLGPHAPYTCPPDYLTKVAKTAAGLGVGIHIHLAETKGEVEDIQARYGATPVALIEKLGLFDLPVLAAHCVHLTTEDISILAEKKVGVAHCPESNLKLASGVAPVAAMLAAGVNVAIGTDGAASNNNLDMVAEMRTCALLAKGISGDPTVVPAHQALVMATLNGARALGLEKDIGTLETGKKADLILVNKHQPHLMPPHNVEANLVYAARGSDVDTVIVNGKILMAAGEVKTLDAGEIYAQVMKRAGRG
ncbi:MAG: 5-methylthioadenosine/S-adenosylhomocysteine deaminase [Moorella sp. (in: firmicutes)]|uniref:amidohydrolase n=1 Tax=unclassified Neomoorella TaxID=2676739 RepID=UPI0010FFBE48|nr:MULTISPECIES: amidohydrolase [unclassified Moorella (in: firmicutes)]MDK2815583.1 5-methylthioadenosine/S-adenosylhomocysteine deaminase [Moorella sp. (in: firmicutes)]GEA15144.1 5-methylthioadenosine/S-adenosylhomocysteine deaminase [Moorella sp. E308F]GEA16944.1 5-methylthioadenosine/S-adenosylhomocysteine deaminase [Moorella sp. E306M]